MNDNATILEDLLQTIAADEEMVEQFAEALGVPKNEFEAFLDNVDVSGVR
jgi:hypothetical protein